MNAAISVSWPYIYRPCNSGPIFGFGNRVNKSRTKRAEPVRFGPITSWPFGSYSVLRSELMRRLHARHAAGAVIKVNKRPPIFSHIPHTQWLRPQIPKGNLPPLPESA
jgi:hypothetical protein